MNVSRVETIEAQGKTVSTGIFKRPIDASAHLGELGISGDEQADPHAHGGPFRAAYAYAGEDYVWWSEQLGRPLSPGSFGENLTLSGIDVSGALIGERWHIGDAVVQVTSPRTPCYKLGIAMGDPHFVKRFADALRPGAYLRVVRSGSIAAGDSVVVASKPDHALSLAEMAKIYFFERARLSELLVPDLTPEWREWVTERLQRS